MPPTKRARRPTPELILLAAERLFAIHGIEAVSLRQIGVGAGQRNTGVVQYHFGTKDDLVQALFLERFAVINDRQLTLHAKLDGEGRLREPRAAIELIARPLADELDTESWWLGVLARVRHYPQELLPYRSLLPELTAGIRQISRLTARHLKPFPASLRDARRDAVVGAIITALSDRQAGEREGARGLPPTGLFLENLIDCATAMLVAPVSETTTAHLHAGGTTQLSKETR